MKVRPLEPLLGKIVSGFGLSRRDLSLLPVWVLISCAFGTRVEITKQQRHVSLYPSGTFNRRSVQLDASPRPILYVKRNSFLVKAIKPPSMW